MDYESCAGTPPGHVGEDEGFTCVRCDADRCPVCGQWFRDYDEFQVHMESDPV